MNINRLNSSHYKEKLDIIQLLNGDFFHCSILACLYDWSELQNKSWMLLWEGLQWRRLLRLLYLLLFFFEAFCELCIALWWLLLDLFKPMWTRESVSQQSVGLLGCPGFGNSGRVYGLLRLCWDMFCVQEFWCSN